MINILPADTFKILQMSLREVGEHWWMRYDDEENKLYLYAPTWDEKAGCCVAAFDLNAHNVELIRRINNG